MNKKLIALIAAALLAVLGVGAVVLYAQGAENRAFDQASLQPVLVVTAPIPAGAQSVKLGGSVELKKLPKVAIVDGAITDLADLGDKVAVGPLAVGEQITTARFGDGVTEAGAEAKPTDLPAGMQTLEIGLATPRVPSTVKPGSTIGLIGTYAAGETAETAAASRMFLSGVRVLDVTTGTVTQEGASGEGKILRLAVTTAMAQEITNVLEYGRIWATDQNDDTDVRGVAATTAKGVFQ